MVARKLAEQKSCRACTAPSLTAIPSSTKQEGRCWTSETTRDPRKQLDSLGRLQISKLGYTSPIMCHPDIEWSQHSKITRSTSVLNFTLSLSGPSYVPHEIGLEIFFLPLWARLERTPNLNSKVNCQAIHLHALWKPYTTLTTFKWRSGRQLIATSMAEQGRKR